MESVGFDVKAEKARAMRSYNQLRSIARLFRLVEFGLALLLLSWTFTRLPFAIKMSCDFIRKLARVLSSPIVVFVVCNAIIVALVAKSGKRFGENMESSNAEGEGELYDEFMKSSDNRVKRLFGDSSLSEEEAVEIEYQDKEMVVSEPSVVSVVDTGFVPDLESQSDNEKHLRRTKSEKLEIRNSDKEEVKLRRLQTEKNMETEDYSEISGVDKLNQDDMSNEEFQRKIEAFIAKQLMFRRQESLAVVVQDQS